MKNYLSQKNEMTTMKEKNGEPSPKKAKGQLIFFSKYNLITLTAFKNALTIDQMIICKVTFGQECRNYIVVLEKLHKTYQWGSITH